MYLYVSMRTTEIDNYIYEVVVPQYAGFDAAHKQDRHASGRRRSGKMK